MASSPVTTPSADFSPPAPLALSPPPPLLSSSPPPSLSPPPSSPPPTPPLLSSSPPPSLSPPPYFPPPTPPLLSSSPPPSLSPPPYSPPPTPPSLSPPPSSPPPTPPSLSPPPSSPPPTPPTTTPPPTSTPSSPPPTIKPPSPPTSVASPPPPPDSSSSASPPSPSLPPPSNDSPTPPSPSSSTPPSEGIPTSPSSFEVQPPPPPLANSAKTPSKDKPTHSKSPPSSSRPDNRSSDLQLPIIIGVVVGVGLFFVLLSVTFLCRAKKKKERPHDPKQFYEGTAGKGSYVPKGSIQNWPIVPQPEPIIKIPPPPGAVAQPGVAWPPPPPVIMHSGDKSSSNFSDPRQQPPSPSTLGFNQSTFSYEELAAATSGFSQANILGQGGFGYVYKGALPNGREVAVKQLKSGSRQGEREFQAEVEIISRVHHRYLVSLIGYCIADVQRMLVYEFVANNTLEYHLHEKGLPSIDWPTRLKIALGSAKGLAYLHEDCYPRIIHRDIKAANILLDYNFEAKVADFGLAKLSSDICTHVSTRVMGTFGYLAPEYASSGKLTEKSDVFSFGVMLLELITGRRPVDIKCMGDCLVEWARPILTQALEAGDYSKLVDPRLENNYNLNEMTRMVASAAASVRHSAKRRPKMSQIVRALEGDVSLEDLNEGVKPGQSSMFSSSGSSEYGLGSYNADMKKFRMMALSSQQLGSTGYSGPTSEYGLNPSTSSSEDEYLQETNLTPNQRPNP